MFARLISVDQADDILAAHAVLDESAHSVAIAASVGCVLAENVLADRDVPPFSRSAMDGICVSTPPDCIKTGSVFLCEGRFDAGHHHACVDIPRDRCVEIMTGAAVPTNAVCVIPYEQTQKYVHSGSVFFRYTGQAITKDNIHKRGTDARAGAVLLSQGERIRANHLQILASVGKADVRVRSACRVAIVPTGDELITSEQTPRYGQIFSSNAVTLQALLRKGGHVCEIFPSGDDLERLSERLRQLRRDFPLIVCVGGISAGLSDFTLEAVQQAGGRVIFHKVQQKPGKPMAFARFANGSLLFALPGNPLSAVLCFVRYVQPMLDRHLGLSALQWWGKWPQPYTLSSSLTHFLPVQTYVDKQAQCHITPLPSSGSADITVFGRMDGWAELPPGRPSVLAGDCLRTWLV